MYACLELTLGSAPRATPPKACCQLRYSHSLEALLSLSDCQVGLRGAGNRPKTLLGRSASVTSAGEAGYAFPAVPPLP